ncbi:MAG: SpoIIE family protein phosphatase [Flavobacteriales bacterium]|nr:SpoIIE family protein phosphatase [Flavobacteriales bacterium]
MRALSFEAPKTTRRKVLFTLYGTLLVLSVTLIAWLHNGQLGSLKSQAFARMGGVTGTLGAQLDGGRVARLLERYDSRGMLINTTQDAWYYVLHENLKKAAEANGLEEPLFVLAYDARKAELQVVVTSDRKPMLRDRFDRASTSSMVDYLNAGRVDAQRGVWGDEIAAFDAVRDSRGKIVGVVYTSSPLGALVSVANGRLWRNIALCAVAFVLIGLFLVRSVGRMVGREEAARDHWQQRHEGITDSIAYAGKIQGALVPRPEQLREMFVEHFVLNRPKDVVSGDFHWYHRLSEDVCIVAAADCTGHGLPGAMMAAIGCSLLNELVVQHPHKDPAELLGLLSERMVRALNQSGQRNGAGDGMDVALCRIDRKQRELLFAGAFRPLYWMHDGQLTVINGDRQPVGGSQHGDHRKFTVHRVAYHEGDRLYLFSDGYVDQFGGPDRKKFMSARFNEMLANNQHLPLAEQAVVLEKAFLEWKGENEQVDDICVVGLAV